MSRNDRGKASSGAVLRELSFPICPAEAVTAMSALDPVICTVGSLVGYSDRTLL